MTQRFSRMHPSGFTRAQVASICALATGPKTARQIAGGRVVGPVTVTLRWLPTNAYATGTDDADNPRADTVYTLTDQGARRPPSHHKALTTCRLWPRPGGAGRSGPETCPVSDS